MELLSVIIILGIIALIIVPIVNEVIKKSKDESNEMSAGNYIEAVEKSALAKDLIETPVVDGIYSVMSNGNICLGTYATNVCSGEVLIVELKGKKPMSGSVEIVNNNVVSISNVKFDKFYANMENNMEIIISK